MMRRAGYHALPNKDTDAPGHKHPSVQPLTKDQQRRDISQYKVDDSDYSLGGSLIPYASIALAVFLMVFGLISLVLAWLHATQAILGKAQAEVGFTVLGLMTFIPGAYHTRIAYYAWKGVPGYSWDDIPSY